MPTNTAEYIEQKAEELVRRGNMGLVTKVFEHDGEEENFSNHEVNVQLINRDEEFKRLPVHVGHMGHVRVPQVGDFVEVSYLTGKTQSAYVSDFAYSRQQRAPLGREGHWRHRFGDSAPYVFLEAEPKDHESTDKDFDTASKANPEDVVRLAVKEDGLSDPTARIEIDTSGSDPVIRITRGEDEQGNTDMGFELDFGTGEFKIGDGSGYGIVSDGNGNFTWYEQSVNFVDDGSTISW